MANDEEPTSAPPDEEEQLETEKVDVLKEISPPEPEPGPEPEPEPQPAKVVVQTKKTTIKVETEPAAQGIQASQGSQGGFGGASLFERRSPFAHDPPEPEERRPRIDSPACLRDYIINLREDLADFQESHGLPRTRDYSFLSLGLALAQETGRALYAVLIMITELFPVLAILSLILRFTLDKLIEILETEDTMPRVKKCALFLLQLIVICIPVWILIGTIIIPLLYLIFSIVKKMLRFTGKKKSCQVITSPKSTTGASCNVSKK